MEGACSIYSSLAHLLGRCVANPSALRVLASDRVCLANEDAEERS